MSGLSKAAQELDEDLRFQFGETDSGDADERRHQLRVVDDARPLLREPIVEAFQASGAETLAEFPERVRFLSDAYYTLLHERDMAKAEANRYHAELVVLRESEHKAKQLAADQQQAINARVSESAYLRDLYGRTLAERDRYKALAEQQSATVAEGAKTIGTLQADLERVKTEWNSARDTNASLRVMLAESPHGTLLAEVEQARANFAKQLSDSNAEEDRLRVELDGVQQELRHVIGLKDRQVVELTQANAKIKDLAEKLTLARDEAGELYATERRLRERIKWAMARIQDLLLGGDL